MFANIVISGGNACFEGMSNRLTKEIASLAPSSTKVKVVQGVDPRNLAWVGASLLASCPGFMDMWITMEDYEERGPEVVHKKCF
jgi:actin